MTHLEQIKIEAVNLLQNLCARCKSGENHNCPVGHLKKEIKKIQGIPVIVNDQLYHVMFN